MSESNETEGSSSTQQVNAAGPSMRFAVIIVLLHLAIIVAFNSFASTNLQNLLGLGIAPLVVALLLVGWWMASKGVPKKDRTLGLLLFSTIVVGITALHTNNGIYLLLIALPNLTTAIVAALAFTTRKTWPARRLITVGVMALWTIIFALVRVDAVGGDLFPVMAWRWEPPMEREFMASTTDASTPPTEPITLPAVLTNEDWPGFRGTDRDGRANVAAFSTDWGQNAPKELWRRDVGLGWSSFTAIGDYIFTQEQRGDGEFVVCYSAETGDEVWTNYLPARFDDTMGSGPRATPTYADGKLYTQGATGILQCLDASTGATLWKRDIREDTGASLPQWGFASSPLITNDKVIVFAGADAGKSIIAYELDTGEPAWTSGDGSQGYCSVHQTEFAGVTQILMVSNFGIQSFLPETGEQLWEHEWSMGGNARVTQPLLTGNDSVIVGSSFGKGSRLLTISKSDNTWNVKEEWTTKKIRPYFNDIVVHEGNLYGYDGNRITSVNAATGELNWKGKRFGGQVLLLPEMDIFLSVTEKGDVVLIKATPEEYTEIARIKALNGKTWNHPVIAHGRLFVRNSEEAVCFELPGT